MVFYNCRLTANYVRKLVFHTHRERSTATAYSTERCITGTFLSQHAQMLIAADGFRQTASLHSSTRYTDRNRDGESSGRTVSQREADARRYPTARQAY
jgi:hypothetical protein